MRILLAILLGVAAVGSASPRQENARPPEMLVGVAAIDITPDEPIRLTGYGSRTAPTSDIRQRLRAKALAFGGGRTRPSILITSDLIGVPRHVTAEVARRPEEA